MFRSNTKNIAKRWQKINKSTREKHKSSSRGTGEGEDKSWVPRAAVLGRAHMPGRTHSLTHTGTARSRTATDGHTGAEPSRAEPWRRRWPRTPGLRWEKAPLCLSRHRLPVPCPPPARAVSCQHPAGYGSPPATLPSPQCPLADGCPHARPVPAVFPQGSRSAGTRVRVAERAARSCPYLSSWRRGGRIGRTGRGGAAAGSGGRGALPAYCRAMPRRGPCCPAPAVPLPLALAPRPPEAPSSRRQPRGARPGPASLPPPRGRGRGRGREEGAGSGSRRGWGDRTPSRRDPRGSRGAGPRQPGLCVGSSPGRDLRGARQWPGQLKWDVVFPAGERSCPCAAHARAGTWGIPRGCELSRLPTPACLTRETPTEGSWSGGAWLSAGKRLQDMPNSPWCWTKGHE